MPAGTLSGVESPALNDRGEVVVPRYGEARPRDPGGHLRARGRREASKVVAQGDAAPAGGSFAGFGAPVLNNKGVIGFAAAVEGRAVPGGIFTAAGEGIRMLVGAGDDTPVGGIFFKFSERFSLNDAGAVAFNAMLKDAPTAGGQFVIQAGRVLKVAVIGDAAPGAARSRISGSGPGSTPAGRSHSSPRWMAGRARWPSSWESGAGGADRRNRRRFAGGRLQSFGLYPLVAINDAGGVTFSSCPHRHRGRAPKGYTLTGPDARP